jgi:C-22 sterol desaturase
MVFSSLYRSASAALPSSTSSPLLSIPRPSFLNLPRESTSAWLYTTSAIVLSLLAIEQAVYRYKKRHLPGAAWTIPIIGKFADSLNPTLENYKKQWDSGALSAVSVFNMYACPQHSILDWH